MGSAAVLSCPWAMDQAAQEAGIVLAYQDDQWHARAVVVVEQLLPTLLWAVGEVASGGELLCGAEGLPQRPDTFAASMLFVVVPIQRVP